MTSGAHTKIDEKTFIELYEKYGQRETARKLNCTSDVVARRRRNLERKHNITIMSPPPIRGNTKVFHAGGNHPGRIECELKNSIVIVASDFHYWPGPKSTMHRAIIKIIKELEPEIFIANGDVVDMAAVSRHPPIGWEKQPTVKDEIETAQERLGEIEYNLKRGTRKIWPLGNHDGRFETRLATVAPEYAKLKGIHLQDHFPTWEPCWSCFINNNVVVKHRFKGGIHAPWNNTINSGMTTITGHLHSAKVVPFTDYNGTRYGVDTGCVADTNHVAFNYCEDNPRNWRSAFAVLTFKDGQLLYPELVIKWNEDQVQFRGKLIVV